MRIVRRWVDRRRVRALRRDWESFRTMIEPNLPAGESSVEIDEGMPDPTGDEAAGSGSPAEWRFIPDVEPETLSAEIDCARSGAPRPSVSAVPVSLAEEKRFLVLKTRIARRSPLLQQVVGGRALEEEALAAGRDMADLMTRAGTLVAARRFPPHEGDDFRREWHVVYLFLAKLEGAMTGSAETGAVLLRPGTSAGSARTVFAGANRPRAGVAWGKAISFVVEAAILLVFVWMAASMLGIKPGDVRSSLRETWAGVSRSERASVAASNKSVAKVEGAAVVQAPTGETEVTAPAAPASSSRAVVTAPANPTPGTSASGIPAASAVHFRMPRVVQPVILRYGTLGAFLLFGAFVSGLLLVFGMRSR